MVGKFYNSRVGKRSEAYMKIYFIVFLSKFNLCDFVCSLLTTETAVSSQAFRIKVYFVE